jgi:hypothetical protein
MIFSFFLGRPGLLLADQSGQYHNFSLRRAVAFTDLMDMSVLQSTSSEYWLCQCAVDQKKGMMFDRVRIGMLDDFTITTICGHGIPSLAGTPHVHVPK